MFDPVTSEIMASAPPLDDLDLQELPKRLTEAYVEIVSARIRLREEPAQASENLSKIIGEMRRLSATQEALVALAPERENRAAAAFVAASAHQVCLLAERSRAPEKQGTRINIATVAPEVCTTLLYLVAEAHADAAEAAKRISPAEDASACERTLISGIARLAQGRLWAVLDLDIPEVSDDASQAERALEALMQLLFRGVRALAVRLRTRVDRALDDGGPEPPSSFFLKVKALAIHELDVGTDGEVIALYPGPVHLANLLLAVERDLLGTAITRIPAPAGVEEMGWWQVLRRMAQKRPYLWRNHLQAINEGYLSQGVSSAISFPTGGGKSTLAELKIATALLRGEKVIFLAPTHALVDQTAKALQNTFQTYDILGDVDDDAILADLVILPEVIVTTPERCLMLMSLEPEAFEDVGLVVFDECHLLHPREADRSRRAIDSMLSVINLTLAAPTADILLLSAMMRNAKELAGWVESITDRPCLALDLAWKPTRQVRGSVVYPATRIADLNDKLRAARVAKPQQKTVPAPVKRELTAQPLGLFCLLQTWASRNREDYTLQPLLDENLAFGTGRSKGGNWYLTPNGNETSAAIAAAAARNGTKSLVFVQTTVFCESAASKFKGKGDWKPIALTEEEQALRRITEEEMGGAPHCFLELDADGTFAGGAASHHALLLREERHLHESLFKRRDGVDVLFATSTLAQGMNLPSEIVLIAGDSRFDPEADKMARLEAYELLNAAGRAGRAGERAQGFVLVIPSRVIEFDDQNNLINDHWLTLQSIFSQSDQCLTIDDPLTPLLDRIHEGALTQGLVPYLLSKLPPSAADDPQSPIRSILNRSLTGYRARQGADDEWIETRIADAIAARGQIDLPEGDGWLEHVSGSTGLPVELLQSLMAMVDSGLLTGDSIQVVSVLLSWIEENPNLLFHLARPENIEGLFGQEYAKIEGDLERANYAIPYLKELLPIWMAG